jgi:hypothetical protein
LPPTEGTRPRSGGQEGGTEPTQPAIRIRMHEPELRDAAGEDAVAHYMLHPLQPVYPADRTFVVAAGTVALTRSRSLAESPRGFAREDREQARRGPAAQREHPRRRESGRERNAKTTGKTVQKRETPREALAAFGVNSSGSGVRC